jgi:hypothetical protein
MQQTDFRSISTLALAAILLGACAQREPVMRPDQPQPQLPQPQLPQPQIPEPSVVEPPPILKIDPMAEVPGDKPLPALRGAAERIDCMIGKEDLHARIAFEARGGQVTYFAYYSKWKPRTCSLDFARNAPGTKWRLTPDGATRVHTPRGRFLIRTQADAYVFEFEQVQRQKFCGMPGEINGFMTIKRGAGTPECSVVGVMDANDPYLDGLHKLK